MAWLLWSPRRSTGGNHEVKQTAPNGIATFNTPHRMETNAETMPPQRHRSACSPADRGKPIISFGRSLNTSVQPAGCKATPHPQLLPLPTTTCNTHKMRPATVAKWLEENANAPPPPATPAGLPDDSVSTVYPESSVSNPYASRYTGTRHRSIPFARGTQPSYIERRPLSAQAHHRDHHQPIYVAPPSRPRHNSFSPESRYIPSQPQPFAYTYHGPPSPLHTGKHSRDASHLIRSPQYRVVSSSPNREDISVRIISVLMWSSYSYFYLFILLAVARVTPTSAREVLFYPYHYTRDTIVCQKAVITAPPIWHWFWTEIIPSIPLIVQFSIT